MVFFRYFLEHLGWCLYVFRHEYYPWTRQKSKYDGRIFFVFQITPQNEVKGSTIWIPGWSVNDLFLTSHVQGFSYQKRCSLVCYVTRSAVLLNHIKSKPLSNSVTPTMWRDPWYIITQNITNLLNRLVYVNVHYLIPT